MFYAFGGSKTLVKHTFFIMILTWDYTKTLTGTQINQKKQTTRCTKHRQAPKKPKKNKQIQQLLRSGPIVPGNFSFFCFFWCLCRFGASSGLVFLVFLVPVQVWWLWLHKTLTDTQKKQKKQTTRCTKHRQAPKKTKKQKSQQLLRSGPIVPGNFSFFGFFWCLCRFGASSGLVFFGFFGACAGLVTLTSQNIDRHQRNQKKQTTRFTKHRQAPKKQKKKSSNYSEVDHSSWKF